MKEDNAKAILVFVDMLIIEEGESALEVLATMSRAVTAAIERKKAKKDHPHPHPHEHTKH